MKEKMIGYYFITDAGLSRRGNISDVKSALAAGVGIIQYRNKNAAGSQMYEEALELRSLCRGKTLLVNDRVDIALAVGADGVHLGQNDIPYGIARKILGKKKIIGLTVHNLKEARQAQRWGADYIGVAPVFPTSTKSDAAKAVGIKLIREIKRRINIPVVALGGVNLSNARDIIRAGAGGLCAISAVVSKKDVRAEIRKYQRLFKDVQG